MASHTPPDAEPARRAAVVRALSCVRIGEGRQRRRLSRSKVRRGATTTHRPPRFMIVGRRIEMHRKDFLQALGFGSLGVASFARIDPAKWETEASTVTSGQVSVMNLGATGNGTTNDAPALQNAFDAFNKSTINRGRGGALYFPKGYYLCTSDINYFLNSRSEGGSILLQGDGVDNTFIHFKGADFTDGMVSQGWTDWNTGWTQLVIKDLTLKFDGDSDTGKGRWKGQLTMPHMDSVRLRTGGY
jgi:hypothetical protein